MAGELTRTFQFEEEFSRTLHCIPVKLSRPSHENKNFLPAAKEFGLRK